MSRPIGSKNRKHKKFTPKKSKSLKKRGRGRPKGSKNKKYKVAKDNEVKRCRGRPKNPVIVIELPPASIVKKSKFIGYCSKCSAMVCKSDLEGKFIFVCSCGNRARIKTLKKVVESERFVSKKEYMEAVMDSKHIEMLPLQESQIDPKDLKVVE